MPPRRRRCPAAVDHAEADPARRAAGQRREHALASGCRLHRLDALRVRFSSTCRPWCGSHPRAAGGQLGELDARRSCAPAAGPTAAPRRSQSARDDLAPTARRTKSCTLLITRPARSACSAMRCAAALQQASSRRPGPAIGFSSEPARPSGDGRQQRGSARGSAARPYLAHRWPERAVACSFSCCWRELLGAARCAPGRPRCSSSRVPALAVDQRRLEDQHRKRSPLRHEDGLEAGTRLLTLRPGTVRPPRRTLWRRAYHGQLGRPIRRRGQAPSVRRRWKPPSHRTPG